jgi:hypothetical protein
VCITKTEKDDDDDVYYYIQKAKSEAQRGKPKGTLLHAVRPFFFLVRFKEDNFSERGPCRMVLGQEC